MFPNFRLLLAATFASVVTLSFGFAVFAALRVNHEPLSQLAAGTASLQLVDDEAAAPPPAWGAPYGSTVRSHEAIIGAGGRTAQMPQPIRFWEVRPADAPTAPRAAVEDMSGSQRHTATATIISSVAPRTSSGAIQAPALAPALAQAALPKKAQTASAANRIAAPKPTAPVVSEQKAGVEPGSSAGGTEVAATGAASASAQQQPSAKTVAVQAAPAKKTQSDSGTIVGSNKNATPAPVSARTVAAAAATSAIATTAPAARTVTAKRTDGDKAAETEKIVSPANRHTEVATAAPHAAAAEASARPGLVRRIRQSPSRRVVRKPLDHRRRVVTRRRVIRKVATRTIARSRRDSTFDDPVFISAPNFQQHTGSGQTARSAQPTASYASPNDE
jgi:hypothetical protein